MVICKECKWFVPSKVQGYYPSDPYCNHESCFETYMEPTSICYQAQYGIKEYEKSRRITDYCAKNANNDCPTFETWYKSKLWRLIR